MLVLVSGAVAEAGVGVGVIGVVVVAAAVFAIWREILSCRF